MKRLIKERIKRTSLYNRFIGIEATQREILYGMKSRSIVEFCLGQSSKMVHLYANYFHVDAVTEKKPYISSKNHTLICSADMKFLTSL